MMDFLRRLAPRRESDATQAVALLPSRFANESPLRAMLGQARPAQRLDEDEASLSFDTSEPPAATNTSEAQDRPVTGVQPAHATPRPLGIEPTHRDNGKAASSTHAPAEAPHIPGADPRASQHRQGVADRARPTSPELHDLVAPLAASPGLQAVTAPPTQPHVTLPLSQAALAQRTLQSRDDGQVVHVTIGRIDVVASTAPAPVARRNPTPREPTVTLSDYLRGSNGSRR